MSNTGHRFDAVTFGSRITYFRRIQELSIAAAAAQIGISFSSLSRIERGQPPSIEAFVRIISWAGWGGFSVKTFYD